MSTRRGARLSIWVLALLIARCLAAIGCSPTGGNATGSVLEPGTPLPAELRKLEVRSVEGAPQIEGMFTSRGRTIRFFTRRGPRVSLDEVMSGANEFEIDTCFVNEKGHSLIVGAGGHQNTMPECPDVLEGRVEGEGADDFEGQAVVVAAMEVLLRLPFQRSYRAEQRSLTGPLEFLRRPPASRAALEPDGTDPPSR